MKSFFLFALPMLSALAAPAPAPSPISIEDPETTFNATAWDGDSEHILLKRTDAPFGIKKGLAYGKGSITDVLSRPGSATWAYNWGTALNAPKFQQIPMMWGPGSQGDTQGILRKIGMGDTPWVLGYNEPDELYSNGGCQKTPKEAYDAWGNDMFKFRDRGARLVCPAVTSFNSGAGHTGGPSGIAWLRAFALYKNNPNEFRCDAQALHWYGVNGQSGAQQAQLFISYLSWAHGEINGIFRRDMPIWVTEFAPLPVHNVQVMADFLRVVIPWMDTQSWIHRYSPFIADDLVSGTSLNAAGNIFVNTK